MTAITSFKDVARQENNIGHLKLAPGVSIPEGALVGVNAQGLATNAAESTADTVVGVAASPAGVGLGKTADHVQFWTYGVITVNAAFSAKQSDIAAYVKVKDNQTVDKVTLPADAGKECGRIVEVLSSSKIRIALKTV